MTRKTIAEYTTAIVTILVLGIALARPTINHFPAFIHAWAQSDWYSLAIGFHNNGFDFLHPETLIYNKQFPNLWMTDNGTTVTSVDFPIHVYIAALLMNLFGTTAPWVFRIWTLAVSLVGLWFLFLLCRRITGNLTKSLTVVCVAVTSPVYAYYFNGFLPSMPSLALVFGGLWAYIAYLQEKKLKYWHLAIASLALATLIRTSQAVPFVAVCCFEVFRWIFCRKEYNFNKIQILPIAVSFIAIVGYMIWNAHLRAANGSLFLNSLMPAKSLEEARTVIDTMEWRKFRYFSEIQHFIVGETVLAAVAYIILKRIKVSRDSLIWFTAIYSFGALLFFVAMFVQFQNHDYYFLDSLFTPIILIFILTIKQLPELNRWWKAIPAVLLVVFGCTMYNAAKHDIRIILNQSDRALECNRNYEGSAQWLDSIGISRNAKILTLGAYPQNSPFIKMERKGYTAMSTNKRLVDNVILFNFDYVIIEDNIDETDKENISYVLAQLDRIDGNGKISIYKRKATETKNEN